jgi:hypothetical protein
MITDSDHFWPKSSSALADAAVIADSDHPSGQWAATLPVDAEVISHSDHRAIGDAACRHSPRWPRRVATSLSP